VQVCRIDEGASLTLVQSRQIGAAPTRVDGMCGKSVAIESMHPHSGKLIRQSIGRRDGEQQEKDQDHQENSASLSHTASYFLSERTLHVVCRRADANASPIGGWVIELQWSGVLLIRARKGDSNASLE
jgi:hypothetical protein